eukprot:4545076-Pyramimonas_sp.AAC.1
MSRFQARPRDSRLAAFGITFGHVVAFGIAFGHVAAFGIAFGHVVAFGIAFGHVVVDGDARAVAFVLTFGQIGSSGFYVQSRLGVEPWLFESSSERSTAPLPGRGYSTACSYRSGALAYCTQPSGFGKLLVTSSHFCSRGVLADVDVHGDVLPDAAHPAAGVGAARAHGLGRGPHHRDQHRQQPQGA